MRQNRCFCHETFTEICSSSGIMLKWHLHTTVPQLATHILILRRAFINFKFLRLGQPDFDDDVAEESSGANVAVPS